MGWVKWNILWAYWVRGVRLVGLGLCMCVLVSCDFCKQLVAE